VRLENQKRVNMNARKTDLRHGITNWTSVPRLGVAALLTVACAPGQINVLTANYDRYRSNSNLSETTLNPQTVNSASFGKIGSFPVDGQIYAQPLYVTGVNIEGVGSRNVVYIATMHNSVYAIDADAPRSTTPLWAVNLGPSILSAVFNFTDILPEVGILSTPVIDPKQGVIYVVSATLEKNTPVFRLHALSLSSGSEQLNGPVTIRASVQGSGQGSNQGVLAFDPSMQLQRPGLALANGRLYISFGSHADMGTWHGWLISYDASDLQRQVAVFNSTPNGLGGSIWQGGRAPAIDELGDIYVVTGNGDYDGTSSFSESLLRLSDSNEQGRTSLAIKEWFTPENWSTLNDNDWDFGTTGAILVPGTNLLLAGSKAGILYAVQRDGMPHSQPTAWSSIQTVQANQWGMFDMALWSNQNGPIVYLAEPYNAVKAFQMVNGQLNNTPSSQFFITSSFFAGLAVSADGGKNGTAVVWLTTGNTDVTQIPGTLHALDAADLSNELWNSDRMGDRDGLGRFAKFATPTVANGKVFVPTFSDALVIYGLLGPNSQTSASPQISAVVNGASFIGGAVSPGEIVAIFGANLGVSQLTQMQVSANGTVSTSLAGTQVLVNGAPAPLLYVSATQVGAVMPFGLNGTTAQFQILYNGLMSTSLNVPLTSTVPGLFSVQGDGGGPGVFNSDGSTSDWNALTPAGSVVTFYATGAGQTVPTSVDGTSAIGPSFPTPFLPIAVFIDGQNAEVLYAGAAPGMVAGLLQVNVRVPETVSGMDLQVVLKVGDAISPNFLWLDVQ
jgi:uncharacterized protein (TIGR03437 family)